MNRLAGPTGNLEGEYKRLKKDTLDNFSDNHRLYVWQRILYLACIRPDIGIDINKLLELYLAGPPTEPAVYTPWYKRWQVWVVGILVTGAVIAACSGGGEGGSSGEGGKGGGC